MKNEMRNGMFFKFARRLFVGRFPAIACMLVLLPVAAYPQNSGRQFLRGHVPAAVTRLHLPPEGRLSATNRLNLAIGLPLRNQQALNHLLQQIYDPASPQYHHYLTPQEFTQQFGPTKADYQAVIAFARAHDLTVTATHPNRLLVDVSGTAATIQNTFHVTLHTYRHPTENRAFYAPDAEPSLDLATPILHVSGLDNFSLPRPRLQSVQLINVSNASPDDGSGPGGTYIGKDFRKAYAPNSTLDGSGQAVGLLQFDGYTASDITYYESLAGLPSVTLSNVLIDGASGLPSLTGGELEVSLDIEMAISMATNLSKVILYMAPNPSPFEDLLNRMATDNDARQISCSWYMPNGPANPAADQIFQEMAAQGQSFFCASGDFDAYTGLIDFPSDTPYVTEVGGTTLTTAKLDGAWVSETVWNRGNGIGSGGGISTQYPIPTWQTNVSMAANQGSTTMRNVPDVALIAENVYVRVNGGDRTVGGTSCAAPLWAAFVALINQQAARIGQSPMGFINPAVYALGARTNYTSVFHDITTGDNTSSDSPTQFYAVPGYDLCTGWGTPTGQKTIDAFVPPILVKLPVSATEGDGLLPGAGQIQLPAQPNDVAVTLISSDPAQLSFPAEVIVPAGQTNAAFDLTILDDGILDGTQIATVTASVPGVGSGSANMMVFDHETTTLQVLLPATVTKDQGVVPGTVQAGAPVGADVTIALLSTATNLIQVPTSAVIPAGQTSAVFTATVLTDGRINGGQTVNVTAHVRNWTDGVTTVAVQDDMNLTVSLPVSAWENAGVLANAGSVSLAGTSTNNTVIALASSNPSKLIVPATVTIFAGSLFETFNVTPVDDPLVEGHQLITITASAPGFTNGSASMLVLDKESPPFPLNPRPADLAVNVPANTNLMWFYPNEFIANGGFETGTLAGWAPVTNLQGGQFYITDGPRAPFSSDSELPPYAGSFSAVADENGPGTFYMYQTVTVPAGVAAVTLSWAHRVRNFYGYDNGQQFQVRICDTNNNVLATPFTTQSGDPLLGDWTLESYDMTAFAGRTVRVTFWVNVAKPYLEVYVDNVSVLMRLATNSLGTITNDVYFGANPTPGPAEFQGTTTNNSWTLPLLAPETTYYWQIIAHRVGSATGAVWQFTTAGADHFAWNPIYPTQMVDQPFATTITAQDAFNTTVTNFSGPVGLIGRLNIIESNQLVTFDDLRANGHVPAGYAGLTWSNFYYLLGTNLTSSGYAPGTVSPPNVAYNINGGPASIISTGEMNFVSAYLTSAWRDNLQVRVQGYSGATPVYSNTYTLNVTSPTLINFNYLRVTSVGFTSFGGTPHFGLGASGTNFAMDNVLVGPSAPLVSITPTNSGSFTNGVWSGNLTVLAARTNVVMWADDGARHTGKSSPFDVILPPPPVILMQPASQTVLGGTNVTFTVSATGTPPLNYFWQKNNSPLAEAYAPSLVLSNVVRTNSGSYSVIVTNFGGSVTSSNATLLVHVPQLLGLPTLLPDGTLTFTSRDLDGGTVSATDLANLQAQASTNLTDWTVLPGALTLTNGILQIQDTAFTNMPTRFYRIIENW